MCTCFICVPVLAFYPSIEIYAALCGNYYSVVDNFLLFLQPNNKLPVRVNYRDQWSMTFTVYLQFYLFLTRIAFLYIVLQVFTFTMLFILKKNQELGTNRFYLWERLPTYILEVGDKQNVLYL